MPLDVASDAVGVACCGHSFVFEKQQRGLINQKCTLQLWMMTMHKAMLPTLYQLVNQLHSH
jgi:hypothetical protein